MPSARSSRWLEAAARAGSGGGHRSAAALRLPARTSALQLARDYADAAARAFGLDVRGRKEFVFAANEAVTNAIRHGTPDADGTIGVRISAEGDRLTIEVASCGKFVPSEVDPATLPDHGRGFPFMERLMDEVEVAPQGRRTVVRLSKRRDTGPATGATA